MHKSIWREIFGVAVISAGLMLSACSGGGGASGSVSSTPTTTTTPSAIVLSTSSRSIKSDSSDSATITASVVDKNNLAVGGATVKFTSNSGQLGTSSGVSSATGAVTIPFKAGTDPTNRTEVVTATISGTAISSTIPIKVVGSTLTVSSTPKNNSTNDVSVTAVAKDVSGTVVENQDIHFSIDTSVCTASASCGNGTLSASSARTNSSGEAKMTVTPTATGPVTIKAEWFNSSGASTYSLNTTISVVAVGTSFAVTTPADNNWHVPLDSVSPPVASTQAVSISVPSTISGKAVASVRLATTLGTWSNGLKSIKWIPSANTVNEVFRAGSSAGKANIQIDALDSADTVLASLSRVFELSAPASMAGIITLQPSVSNVAPSTGGTTNTATLTATVRTAGSPANAVGEAPVLFEIVNSTGSGEQISPVLVYTNSSGQAQTTFTSGTQSTIGGLQIKATVLNIASTVTDTKTIFVNSTGVSVTLGKSSTIDSSSNNANYDLPMSVLVVDNAGTAVSNALVTLSAFPTRYYFGRRGLKCVPLPLDQNGNTVTPDSTATPVFTGGISNEDTNENDILDPGEDQDPWFLAGYLGRVTPLVDGLITPPHATAGTVPSTVTTDANGVAAFKLTYQKEYANWVQARIRAKVVIATGTTESTNELKFILPISAADAAIDPCPLGASPFNP